MHFRLIFPLLFLTFSLWAENPNRSSHRLVYIAADTTIPFWEIMGRGIRHQADSLGYELQILNSGNSLKHELELVISAVNEGVSGIIISPSNSSSCATVLRFAEEAGIPAVISDVGTDGGEYVSYVASDNYGGAYRIGRVLASALKKRGWGKGRVGIIAIPQKRLNGQARTAGFKKALKESGIKGADIKQIRDWSSDETYRYTMEMVQTHPDLRAVWLQTSNIYPGALKAIRDAGKEKELLLVAFDAEPEFLELIPEGVLVGSAMQQPFLMGEKALLAMDAHLRGEAVPKEILVPILSVSTDDITAQLPQIKRNVLGIVKEEQ